MTVLTSDFVQIIPTFDNLASLASSNTVLTPTSVVARPMLQMAKISWHSRIYLSVILSRAEFESRSPGRSTRMSPLLKMCAFRRTLASVSQIPACSKNCLITHLIFLIKGQSTGSVELHRSEVSFMSRDAHSATLFNLWSEDMAPGTLLGLG